jgi:tetratricopeptide (TPR) repeat protein
LVLVIVTFVAYQPTWHAGFIWDDDLLITDNRMVQARDGLYRFWFTTEALDYYPLTSSFWWLQWRLWGRNAEGYHAANVLLHAANVLLIWIILRHLRIPGAWLAALLFAVHPVNVASVAWISEQKNTLSMLFFALSILCYLRFDEENERYWYGFSLAAFLLALLSKAAVVMLPVVLLGCVWWLRGRLRSRDWLRAAPFFALSILLGLTTVWFQYHRALNGQVVRASGLFSRLAVAGLAPWFYLSKAVLPLDLCMVYPQWNPAAWGWSGWLPGIALAGGVALLWWKRDGWGRPLLFGFGYFVVMLFPVLGFFDQSFHQYSMVADHWQYYSIAGVAALAAAGAVALGSRLHREQLQVVGPVAGVVVIVLGTLSWQRCLVFRDQETLFRDNLLHNPLAWVAHYNLGVALAQTGKTGEAIAHYEQALRIKPGFVEVHYNLGMALAQTGKTGEAIAHFEQALRIKPDFAKAHNNLGMALAQTGKIEEAIAHFKQALQVNPDFAEAHGNLGIALAHVGRLPEAIVQYGQALRINPDFAEAHGNLGNALVQAGRVPEAILQYEQALRIKPDYAEAHYNLGDAFLREGKISDAIGQYEQALRLNPNFAEAHKGLGLALKQMGKDPEAAEQYEEALRIKPDYPQALNNLAWLLATHVSTDGADPARAVVLAERACRLTENRVATYLDTLAAAYATAGRFDDAVGTAEKAIQLADSTAQTQLASNIEMRLELYRADRAYYEPRNVTDSRNP